MNNLVIRTVEKYNLLKKGDKVIVALSGGADSVALLDILNSLKELYNLTIYAAHVNHGLRGKEADSDEHYCKILCEKYKTELFVKKVDVKVIAKQQKISEELCGRNVRYAFFEELSQSLHAKIATAHTASDNAETLLFNIIRGTSVSGAGGIPPKRDNIIRPLIELTRAQIEQYCLENELDYVTDSSNLTDDYTRNKIRHNIIPLMSQINPQFELSAMRFSENSREVADFLKLQTQTAIKQSKTQYGFDCQKLLSNHTAILKNAVALICKKYAHINPEQKHIDLIVGIIKNGGAVDLSDKYTALSKQGILRIVSVSTADDFNEIELNDNLTFRHRNKSYKIKINNSDKENNPVLRTRQTADKFTYHKRNVTKPLRKVMNEMKIPSELRENLLVLAIGSIVLWCEQIGFSAQGEVFKSETSLSIEVQEEN